MTRRAASTGRLGPALVAALTGAVFLLHVGSAAAQGTTGAGSRPAPTEEVAELDAARALVAESLRQYDAGQTDDAYTTARNAYLDHFEAVEIPLRTRDEGLTLSLEEDFARLRNGMRDGADPGAVRAVAGQVAAGLDDAERTLTAPGLAAPLLAAVSAFTILFREGLEAVLVLAALLGYLEASRNGHYRGAVLRGVAGAVVASAGVFVVFSALLQLAPVQREVLEAVTAVAAVVVLFYVSFWLVARLDQRRWMEFMKAKVWAATATGSSMALFAVGFTAVFREGFETVLFYQALLAFAAGLTVYVALGTAVAAAVLAGVAWALIVAGRRVPVRRFLQIAVLLVMVLSVAFVGNAVRALQQVAVVPTTFLESAPRLPIFLAELTGWHPTVETAVAQLALAATFILGGLWVGVVVPRRASALRPVPVAPATGHGGGE